MLDLRVFIGGASVSAAGQIANRVLNLVFLLCVTRMVDPRDFGQFTFLVAVVGIMYGLSNLGIPRSISYFVPRQQESDPDRAMVVFTAAALILPIILIVSLIGFAFPGIFSRLIELENGKNAFRILVILLFLYAARDLVLEYLRALKEIRKLEYVQSIAFPVSRLVLTVSMLLLGMRLVGLALGHVSAWLVALLAGILAAHRSDKNLLGQCKQIRGAWSGRTRWLRPLLSYSLPLAGVEIIGSFMTHAHKIMLGFLAVAADPGLFQLGASIASLAIVLPSSFTLIAKPFFSELSVTKADGQLLQMFRRSARWSAILTIPPAILLIVHPAEISSLLFSTDYERVASIVPLVAFSVVFPALWGQLAVFLKGTGKTGALLKIHIAMLIALILLNVILIPRHGLLGAAISAVMIAIGDTIMRVGVVWKHLGENPYDRLHLRVQICGGLTFLAALALNTMLETNLQLLLSALAIPFTFFFLLIGFGGIDETDVDLLGILLESIETRIGANLLFVRRVLRFGVRRGKAW